MPHKKGLEWNQLQLKIAKELSLGKTETQIIDEGNFKTFMVYKVAKAIKVGDGPPSLDDAYIAQAPQPTEFVAGWSAKKNYGKQAPPPKDKSKDGGNGKKPPGVVQFMGVKIQCEYTPIMYIAQQAAVEMWHWPNNMRLEDFLDTILYVFFKDRGITLQGYIIDEEVEVKP